MDTLDIFTFLKKKSFKKFFEFFNFPDSYILQIYKMEIAEAFKYPFILRSCKPLDTSGDAERFEFSTEEIQDFTTLEDYIYPFYGLFKIYYRRI